MPESLVSNNSLQFDSKAFHKFYSELDITNRYSTSAYLQRWQRGSQLEFGYKISKTTRRVSLVKDINRLVSKEDGEQLKISFLEMLANDVAVDLNMFGAFVEDIIMSNVDSTMIVTIKRSGSGLRSIHVSQEPVKPNKPASGVGKGVILCLSTGTGNHILLLATSRDKRST